MSSPTVPTLELNSLLASTDSDNWGVVASKLEQFLTTDGYVYLTKHGIPTETIAAAFGKTKDFFELPEEIKLKYLKPSNVVTYHGYSSKFVRDATNSQEILIREYFHVWANPSNRSCDYPNEVPGFGDSILTLLYAESTQNLNRILLRLLSKIIAKNTNELELGPSLDTCHQGCKPDSSIKNYSYFSSMFYPKLPEGVDIGGDKGSSRCSAHTDCSTYTLLFLDQIEGLQKKNLNGQWMDIPPLENGILFIPGDFLEAISRGKFPALIHRVPTDNLKNRDARQSLPVYILPDNDTKFVPVNTTGLVTFGDYYEKLIKQRYFRY